MFSLVEFVKQQRAELCSTWLMCTGGVKVGVCAGGGGDIAWGEVGRSRKTEQLFPCTATTQPRCVYAGNMIASSSFVSVAT